MWLHEAVTKREVNSAWFYISIRGCRVNILKRNLLKTHIKEKCSQAATPSGSYENEK